MKNIATRNNSEEKARWVISPFWTGFVFVLVTGLFFHLVLPYFFPDLFQNGITTYLKDPHGFHKLALEVASKPWTEFTFRPADQFPAGILGFIYKFFGIHKPFMMLPLLALLAGLTIRSIASCLDVLGVKGRWWPIVIGILFTVTPTSFSWMIYPHKDAFIVPGITLITWSFMAATLRRIQVRHFVALLLGSILVFSNKPYFAELFFVGTILAFPFILIKPFDQKNLNFRILLFTFGLIVFSSVIFWKSGYLEAGEAIQSRPQTGTPQFNVNTPRHIQTKKFWKPLPGGKFINKPLLALAYTRERFLNKRPYGTTNFLPEVHLEGALETILFIPRTLQLSLLEPLPWRSVNREMPRNLVFIAAQLEMTLVYASLLFLLFSGTKSWTPPVFICLALALPFLISLGFAAPNVGAINRYRFPFLLLIKLAGFSALWNSSRLKWPGRFLMWADPPDLKRSKKKLLFLVPDDDTFVIQRLVMAQAAQKSGFEVHVACPDLGHAQKIKDLGFIHHNIDLNRGGLNPISDFTAFIKLTFFLARLRPDILHNVSIKPVTYGATAGTIVGLQRMVCLINGLGYAFQAKGLKGKLVLGVAKALYRNALALPGVRVIFQNPDDRDYFVSQRLVDTHKTLLIRGSGVNTHKFPPTPQPQNSKPIVLFVGRLLRSKGMDDLITAAKILKEEKVSFILRIVGEPDERNPEALPREYVEELHKQGVIEWMGRQSDMPKFYREADMIVLPQQNREGLPLTLLEASSSARAIIATDVPGCREVIRHNVNGLMIPPKNPIELAKALKILIEDPELRKKLGETGADIVEKEFSAEIVQKQLSALYESLLNDSVSLSDNLVHA